MKEDEKNKSGSKNNCDSKSSCDSVKSINEKTEKHPIQANQGKEDQSYEEETLMDGVGSSYEDMERTSCDDKSKKKR